MKMFVGGKRDVLVSSKKCTLNIAMTKKSRWNTTHNSHRFSAASKKS
jgi:hypothetical protein